MMEIKKAKETDEERAERWEEDMWEVNSKSLGDFLFCFEMGMA